MEDGVEDLSDDELMLLYQDGKLDAYEVLFDRHRGPLFNYAAWLLRDRTTAEDVMQDVFLQVARNAATYEPRGRFRAWVMRMARNRCLNILASEATRRRALAGFVVEKTHLADGADDAAASLMQEERRHALEQTLANLPERQREALVLYAYEQMPYREVAQILDMPVNTVKTLIHRARAALAQRMEHCAGEEP